LRVPIHRFALAPRIEALLECRLIEAGILGVILERFRVERLAREKPFVIGPEPTLFRGATRCFGRALRMASIDLHVTIEFIAPVIKGDLNLSASGALASIRYHDGSQGLLLYLKPWRPRYLAPDVLSYWAEHSAFPHESTGDQFFEESQFESYRALGEQVASQAFARAEEFPEGARLDPVFAGAAFIARASKARIR